MKKIILLAFIVLLMVGCVEKDSNGHIALNTGSVDNPKISIIDCIVTSIGFIHLEAATLIDWLNAHYFDYRGLIEKGLAIEVTKENNPYKE